MIEWTGASFLRDANPYPRELIELFAEYCHPAEEESKKATLSGEKKSAWRICGASMRSSALSRHEKADSSCFHLFNPFRLCYNPSDRIPLRNGGI